MAYKVIKRAHSANIAAGKDRFLQRQLCRQQLSIARCMLQAPERCLGFVGRWAGRERESSRRSHVCCTVWVYLLEKFAKIGNYECKLRFNKLGANLPTSPPQDSAGRVRYLCTWCPVLLPSAHIVAGINIYLCVVCMYVYILLFKCMCVWTWVFMQCAGHNISSACLLRHAHHKIHCIFWQLSAV